MLGQVRPTEFDLRFSLFSIPVRVHPFFWLAAVLLGAGTLRNPDLGVPALLIWIVCLFFSILIHELGHALFAKWFGWPPQIMLYHFGGLAMYRPDYGYTTSRQILISFAGPAAGFMLYGVVLLTEFILISQGVSVPLLGRFAFLQLKWINLAWGLVNLLPVLPLDGGRICESICQHIDPRRGDYWALWISMIVAGGTAVIFLALRQLIGISFFPAILFGLLCFSNFQAYQARRSGWW